MRKATEDKILYALKSRGELTAEMLAKKLEITTPGAQQQLAGMFEAGLVDTEERKQSRGRPRKYWYLTDKGHGRFPDRHADLTLEILQSTKDIFGDDGLDKLIEHRELRTLENYRAALKSCRSLAKKIETLAELRSSEGYMASWSKADDGAYLLVENHCPICVAAKLCQGLCRSELEIFRDVLGDGVSVEREEHILEGGRRCCYRIVRG